MLPERATSSVMIRLNPSTSKQPLEASAHSRTDALLDSARQVGAARLVSANLMGRGPEELKHLAAGFIVEPIQPSLLEVLLERAIERSTLHRRLRKQPAEIVTVEESEELTGTKETKQSKGGKPVIKQDTKEIAKKAPGKVMKKVFQRKAA